MKRQILTQGEADAAYRLLARHHRGKHLFTNKQRAAGSRSLKWYSTDRQLSIAKGQLTRLGLSAICQPRVPGRPASITIYVDAAYKPPVINA